MRICALAVAGPCGINVASAAEPAPPIALEAQEPAAVPPEAPPSATEQQLTLLRQEMRALHQEMRLLRAQLAQPKPPSEPEPSTPSTPSPLQRGNYYVGGTVSLGYRARDNYETLAGTVDNGRRFTTKLEGVAGYVLRTNLLALGVTVAYRRTLSKGTISDAAGVPSDVNSLEYDVRVGPALRGFLPIDSGNRFFVYAQAAAVFGYGERVERSFLETTSSVLSSNGFSMGLAVQPGLMVVANQNFAFEIGVNVLGLEYQNYKVTTDHTSEGREQDVDVSVDLNLLSLQFAFVGYF